MLKKATIRKEQEPDFEEKRFNVTIGEDEREFDKENDFFRERSYRIIREYYLLILNNCFSDYVFILQLSASLALKYMLNAKLFSVTF